MIILDTCILRGLSLEDSSADFLRTIRAIASDGIAVSAGADDVAVPWMVMEELVAQKAVKYAEMHAAAAAAIDSVSRLTPWELEASLAPCDLERYREHWCKVYGEIAATIPTSETALREALFREANALPPCKGSSSPKDPKKGGRDAAIWLSAVEYAREHPAETVYFVSSNTKDFTDGSSYRAPMDRDIAELGERFVHLTSLDEVVSRFTEEVETDEELVRTILSSDPALRTLVNQARKRLTRFWCTAVVGDLGLDSIDTQALGWFLTVACLRSVTDIKTYQIGEHVWCTAVVEWHLTGAAVLDDPAMITTAGSAWTTPRRIGDETDRAHHTGDLYSDARVDTPSRHLRRGRHGG
ncbi:PIN domain-containing protein [Streptomyces sp. DG2A-72]|uniref:PIN domain-containing protein n=1 Tax=Streptomyces sp. DG2A-72 TaxID=3051386 RepID=UPI00265BCA7F|nr:PIN domain-containing protein [Streptomyces sp. DG2A-72]MDO0939151.1 PIN domain-containing protein [Streptomyces sp. DG2A-72]